MAMSIPTTRFTDVRDEPVTQLLAPIQGYENMPLVSLEEAIKPIAHLFNGIEANIWVAKHNCRRPEEGLTPDESAAIHLYTMQFDDGPSLFQVLNQILRSENRRDLKPWFLFLKLFLTALVKLPSHAQTVVWRGVRDVDLSFKYPKGATVIWWGVSSCTVNLDVLQTDQFLGKTGNRTLFSIECRNGKSIALHSYFKDTMEEIIVMPGSCFKVIDHLNVKEGFHIIHLREIEPPYPLIQAPFAKTEAVRSKCSVAAPKMQRLPTKELTVCARPFDEVVMEPPSSDVPSGSSTKAGTVVLQSHFT